MKIFQWNLIKIILKSRHRQKINKRIWIWKWGDVKVKSKRFQVLSERPVNQDGLIGEWADEGLIALDSPNDPKSSIKIENGIITE